MKRIYFTSVPLDSNFAIELKPLKVANFTISTNIKEYAFPIIPIIDSTMHEGDDCKIIIVRQTNSSGSANYDQLRSELASLNLDRCEVVDVAVDENQSPDLLLGLYKRLLTYTENDACYYADVTFGAKTLPIILFSLLTYVDRILVDTEVSGIYYQEIRRCAGKMTDASLYEISALFSLDSVAYGLSDAPDGTREALFNMILNPNEKK